MASDIVQLRSLRTRYSLSGKPGAPTLMFCNSLMADMSMWNRVASHLDSDWRLLRYDMRGHGGSDAPPGDYTVADLALDAIDLLDYLQLSSVHLVGISLGGMVALQMAAHQPQRFASLTIGNTGTQLSAEARQAWAARGQQVRAHGVQAVADATLARWFTEGFPDREPALAQEVRDMLLSVRPEGYAGCAAAIRDLDIDDTPERIPLRTLFLHGRQDGAWPEAGARALAARLQAQLGFVEDAGHIPCIEQPSAYAGALRTFLEHGT